MPNQSPSGALVVVFQELVRLAPDLTLPVRLCYAGSEVPAEVLRAVQSISPRPVSTCGLSSLRGSSNERALVLYVSAPSNPSPGVYLFPAAYGCGLLCTARFECELHSEAGGHWRLAHMRLFEVS